MGVILRSLYTDIISESVLEQMKPVLHFFDFVVETKNILSTSSEGGGVYDEARVNGS